jgi:hypothetical protein
MNRPLIIISKDTIGYTQGSYHPIGVIGYYISHKGEKATRKTAQEVQEYILVNFDINMHIDDIDRIPFGFPVTVDSLIQTSKESYSRLF